MAVNVAVHPLLQIFPIPARLLVNCGMICPVHAHCGRWGILISAVVADVISFSVGNVDSHGRRCVVNVRNRCRGHEEVSTGTRVGYSCAGVGYGLSWATDRGGCY